MKKIIDSYIIELRLLNRYYGSWFFLLLSLFVIFYHSIFDLQRSDPGGALISTAFIIQGGMFACMILGVYLVQKEAFYWCDEVFDVLPNGQSSKIIAKCLTLISIILAFTCISLIEIYVIFWCKDVPCIFYWKSIYYLFLYWAIPFIISGLLGMILGLYMKSNLIYPVLVLIWLFIGPLNMAVFKPLMGILRVNLNSIADFMNLGQTNPHLSYDPVYGLQLEIGRWLQKGLWLLNVVVLFLISLLKSFNFKSTKTLAIVIIFLLTLNIPLINSFAKEDQVITTKYEYNAVNVYDMCYYTANKQTAFQNNEPFIIESYEIDLASFRNLKAKVIMEIKPLQETEELVFTLYHDLRVKGVFDESGTLLSYEQKGDQVLVSFPKILNKNVLKKIVFDYEGTSSPYFYANEQAVMLPAYFPWIPVAGSYQAMKAENSYLLRKPLISQTPTKYTLKYSGPKPLFTNLSKEDENLWSGKTSSGITLAAGMLTETKIGEINIVYPISLNKMIEGIPGFLENIKPVVENIKTDLALKNTLKSSKLLFLSIPTESSLVSSTIWNLDDHLIIGINQQYNDGDLLNNRRSLVRSVLTSLTRTSNMTEQNERIKASFIAGYAYWYSMNYDQTSYEESKTILHSMIDSYNHLRTIIDNYQELEFAREEIVLNQIKAFIDENKSDHEILQSFFRNWLSALESDKIMDFENVTELISIEKGDR